MEATELPSIDIVSVEWRRAKKAFETCFRYLGVALMMYVPLVIIEKLKLLFCKGVRLQCHYKLVIRREVLLRVLKLAVMDRAEIESVLLALLLPTSLAK